MVSFLTLVSGWGVGGGHVIDATPQEQSYGEFSHFGEWVGGGGGGVGGWHVFDATPQKQSYCKFTHFGEWRGRGDTSLTPHHRSRAMVSHLTVVSGGGGGDTSLTPHHRSRATVS